MAAEIKRVEREFILKTAYEQGIRFEIHLNDLRVGAILTELEEEHLVLTCDEAPEIQDGISVKVFFRFRGHPTTFTSKVLSSEGVSLSLKMPDRLYKDLQREYERIFAPSGISVSFYLDGERIELNYPESEQYDPLDEPVHAAGFDAVRIAELLKTFRQRCAEFGAESKIVMFREREPKGFEEEIISSSGKLLMIPTDTLEAGSSTIAGSVLDEDEIVRIRTQEGEEVFEALEQISKLKSGKAAPTLYCPILYQQYVVGYLYLVRHDESKEAFDTKTVDFVRQFARLLAYSLKVNGYFEGRPVQEEYRQTDLIDISGSGLLFSYPADGPELKLYRELDLTISVGERSLPAKGRVARTYRDSGRAYIGVRFTDLSTEDMEFLFRTLYGSDYQGDVDATGAAYQKNRSDVYFEN
jgi:hypothetical protein